MQNNARIHCDSPPRLSACFDTNSSQVVHFQSHMDTPIPCRAKTSLIHHSRATRQQHHTRTRPDDTRMRLLYAFYSGHQLEQHIHTAKKYPHIPHFRSTHHAKYRLPGAANALNQEDLKGQTSLVTRNPLSAFCPWSWYLWGDVCCQENTIQSSGLVSPLPPVTMPDQHRLQRGEAVTPSSIMYRREGMSSDLM
ncbi:hypothetical protein P3342_005516 [Pyrenophora teres f. teres]|nr:hypothetical protein P3342_005516 [Pyrenophora teres f. teres]